MPRLPGESSLYAGFLSPSLATVPLSFKSIPLGLIYDASKVASLRRLEDLFDEMPQPPMYKSLLGQTDEHLRGHQPQTLKSRVIKMEGSSSSEHFRPKHVLADRYPIIIAGLKLLSNQAREVHEKDIETFARDRPR